MATGALTSPVPHALMEPRGIALKNKAAMMLVATGARQFGVGGKAGALTMSAPKNKCLLFVVTKFALVI